MLIRKSHLAITVVALIGVIPPCFAESIGYGSREGMQDTVITKTGLDTAHAEIHVHHTRADALIYCSNPNGGGMGQETVTEKCIAEDIRA